MIELGQTGGFAASSLAMSSCRNIGSKDLPESHPPVCWRSWWTVTAFSLGSAGNTGVAANRTLSSRNTG